MNTKLLEFLIDNFTECGETILDPMAGSGSTGVVAALHGRDAVCVELEEKFFGWMEEARRKVETQQTLSRKGKIRNVLGDARKLSTLLEEADVVVTSPPYSENVQFADEEFAKKARPNRSCNTGILPSENNIGNLKHGKVVDVVVTSPPYAIDPKNVCHTKEGKTLEDYDKKRGFKPITRSRLGYSPNPSNIGNLPLGKTKVDSIITSPPYADTEKRDRSREDWFDEEREKAKAGGSVSIEKGYQGSEENIGNLKFADCIITSPPYEESLEGGSRHYTKGGGHFKIIDEKKLPTAYSFKNESQIGNLAKETYLEAMLKVYSEMYEVLKPATFKCKCRTLSIEEYEQILHRGLHGRRRIHNMVSQRSQNNHRSENKGSFRTNQSLLGESRLRTSPHLRKNIQEGRRTHALQVADSIHARCRDNLEGHSPIPNSEEKRCLEDIGENSGETSQYSQTGRETSGDVARVRTQLSKVSSVLPLLKPKNTKNLKETWDKRTQRISSEKFSQQRSVQERQPICKSCGEPFQYFPAGKAIIIIKPFIRNKQVIDLPYQTWLLLRKLGFKLVRLMKLRLKQVSFWRVLYRKKYPQVPNINHEYILVTEKISINGSKRK